jgi:hypothetical protein
MQNLLSIGDTLTVASDQVTISFATRKTEAGMDIVHFFHAHVPDVRIRSFNGQATWLQHAWSVRFYHGPDALEYNTKDSKRFTPLLPSSVARFLLFCKYLVHGDIVGRSGVVVLLTFFGQLF